MGLLNKPGFSLGDIQDLYDTKLARGHAAAFSDDCDLPSTHEIVRSIGMQVRSPCSTKKNSCISRLILLSSYFFRLLHINLWDLRGRALEKLDFWCSTGMRETG